MTRVHREMKSHDTIDTLVNQRQLRSKKSQVSDEQNGQVDVNRLINWSFLCLLTRRLFPLSELFEFTYEKLYKTTFCVRIEGKHQ